MGRKPKVVEAQSPSKSPFSASDLVWTLGARHGASNSVTVELAYIPYARVLEFLEGQRNDKDIPTEWNIIKTRAPQEGVKRPQWDTHLGHTW